MYKHQILSSLLLTVITATLTFAGGLRDDFSKVDSPQRQALRGEWTMKNNVAHCVSDPELYKKFANHGPILRWAHEFTDGTVAFEFKPEDCQRLVITLNDAGHVFRISLSDEKRTRIFGWATQSSKTNKPETLIQAGVPTVDALNKQWTNGKIVFKGDKATVRIGDFSAELEHACIKRKKSEFTISFASGALSVRNVVIETP